MVVLLRPWGLPRDRAPSPQFNLWPYISKTIQIPTHKPYIFSFLMRGRIECYYFDDPRGQAPPPQFDLWCSISKTIQIPTPKPYIFLFLMMWQIEWYYCYVPGDYPGVGPRPHNFTYDLISKKQYRSPPINHIYFYSSLCDGLNVTTLMTPGVRPHPLNLTYDVRFVNIFQHSGSGDLDRFLKVIMTR